MNTSGSGFDLVKKVAKPPKEKTGAKVFKGISLVAILVAAPKFYV